MDKTIRITIVQLASLAVNSFWAGIVFITWLDTGYRALLWVGPLVCVWAIWYVGIEEQLRRKK